MKKLLFTATYLILLVAGPVCAHRPIFVESDNTGPEQAARIPNPDTSWAIYADLSAGETHYYQFTVPEAGMEFFAQLLVPTPVREEFRPALALIGPGLPFPEIQPEKIQIPSGMGAVTLPWQDKEVFFEPFTQTRYRMAQELRLDLPGNTYWLAVYQPGDGGGKYTLAVGEEEQWGIRDVFSFPGMWFRTRWWFSPGQTLLIIGGAAGVLAALIRLVYGAALKFCQSR